MRLFRNTKKVIRTILTVLPVMLMCLSFSYEAKASEYTFPNLKKAIKTMKYYASHEEYGENRYVAINIKEKTKWLDEPVVELKQEG